MGTASTAVMLSLLLGSGGMVAISQEPPQEAAKEPALPGELQANVQVWSDLFKVTDHHRWFHDLAGSWRVQGEYYMAPGVIGLGDGTARVLLEGRNLQIEIAMDFAGQRWESIYLLGYSNVQKNYWMLQADTFNTMLTTLQGAPAADGKAVEVGNRYTEPVNGTVRRAGVVLTPVDKEHFRLEMLDSPVDDPKDTKIMTLDFTRKAGT